MTTLSQLRQVYSRATRPTLLSAAGVDHQLKRQRSDTYSALTCLGDAAILRFPSLSIMTGLASGVGVCSSIRDWESSDMLRGGMRWLGHIRTPWT